MVVISKQADAGPCLPDRECPPLVVQGGGEAGGRGMKGREAGRWKLRDEQTSKTSSGTVAFFPPPKWWSSIKIQIHRDPHICQLSCSKGRRLATPHLLTPQLRRGSSPGRWRGSGSAPSHAERASHDTPGGRRLRKAPLATLPPGGEESPTCQMLRLELAGPTVPKQSPALCM